jgi:hypothetical protein
MSDPVDSSGHTLGQSIMLALDFPARLLRMLFSMRTWNRFGSSLPETKALLEHLAWPLLAVVILAAILWSVWWIPKFYAAGLPERAVNKDGQLALVDRIDAEQNTRGLIVQLIGGMVVLGTLYRGWREFQRDQHQRSYDMRHRTEELALTRQNIVDERFSRAINQLGSENRDVRLGGILSLDMLARANPEYHWPVLDVLASYIQEHTRESHAAAERAAEAGCLTELPPLPNDIYFALYALTNRNTANDSLANSYIDLSNTCLTNARIAAFADMRWCDLSNSHAENACFREVDLLKANLAGASMIGSDFERANLTQANLNGAVLDNASLIDARGLTWEQLDSARSLRGAVLPAHLVGSESGRARAAKEGAKVETVRDSA